MAKKDSTKTSTPKQPVGEWHFIDAKNRVLGRLATEAANYLIGKNRPDYMPNLVAPVYVVITNTDHVVLTGNKETSKSYYHHSGYPGGIHSRTVEEQRKRDSRKIVRYAIEGMLPKNNLRPRRLAQLKLYAGAEHPHLPQTNLQAK
jgi:large subunit ribosomal protein L13